MSNVLIIRQIYLEADKKAFLDLLDELKKDNICIIFIASPVYLGEKYNQDLRGFKFIDSLSDKLKIPFLNYNLENVSDMNFNKNYFADCLHLNENGSILFSKKVKEDIRKYLHLY